MHKKKASNRWVRACALASSFTLLLNLNHPSLFPARSSGSHLLSRLVPSFRAAVRSKHQTVPSNRAASAAVIVRRAPGQQGGGDVRFYLHLPSPPLFSVGVRQNSALISVSTKVLWGGRRSVSTRGRKSRRRANKFGRARPEVFLQKKRWCRA